MQLVEMHLCPMTDFFSSATRLKLKPHWASVDIESLRGN